MHATDVQSANERHNPEAAANARLQDVDDPYVFFLDVRRVDRFPLTPVGRVASYTSLLMLAGFRLWGSRPRLPHTPSLEPSADRTASAGL